MSKRGNYGEWSAEDLALALAAYKDGSKGLNRCSRDYGIAKSTLIRHIRESNKVAIGTTKVLGRNPTFGAAIEELLADHIVKLSEKGRKLSYLSKKYLKMKQQRLKRKHGGSVKNVKRKNLRT